MKEIFGKLPVLFFLEDDMDSSKTLMTDAAAILALLLLKSAISLDNMYYGS
jgi:hypothetical protein